MAIVTSLFTSLFLSSSVPALPSAGTLPAQAARTAPEVRVGPYRVILRVPEEGIVAGEELDLEFRVEDTRAKDPVEPGFKGVAGIRAAGVATMPSMAGMPAMRPRIHREGVPGDYGCELFFPHGGEYQLVLSLEIPGDQVRTATFRLNVSDERAGGPARPAPFRLQVIDWPSQARAGETQELQLRVIDRSQNRSVREFDVAHERKFHLLVVSEDLSWFLHEHPQMSAGGLWSIPLTLPFAGRYWVYGDVAPAGRGSQIVSNQITVAGPARKPASLAPKARDIQSGIVGTLKPVEPITVGRSAIVELTLRDANTGQAIGDTQPWLGAAGHLMIFHRDGKTVVHSHPEESDLSARLVRNGRLRFTARFPRAGMYRAFAQVQRAGRIETFGFGMEVAE
ncbi:MAG: hypothetical protein SFX74_07075 [Fimbriimonadaceae bacterium]|nr:hypothetical protein [Fimbriimonadaceae bacterium]